MVAAYLSICNELQLKKVRYASAKMVLGISDKCIRDFLSQIDQIFRKTELNLNNFLEKRIKTKLQHEAIETASKQKDNSIPESGVLKPVQVGRIVKGFATITATLQKRSSDKSHLKSSERGLFQFAGNIKNTDDGQENIKLIRDAADAGFLRIKLNKNDIESFRVHASLAPAYGFSYRGAYYKVKISLKDFNHLKNAKNEAELKEATQSIIKKISPKRGEPTLFQNIEDDGSK